MPMAAANRVESEQQPAKREMEKELDRECGGAGPWSLQEFQESWIFFSLYQITETIAAKKNLSDCSFILKKEFTWTSRTQFKSLSFCLSPLSFFPKAQPKP